MGLLGGAGAYNADCPPEEEGKHSGGKFQASAQRTDDGAGKGKQLSSARQNRSPFPVPEGGGFLYGR